MSAEILGEKDGDHTLLGVTRRIRAGVYTWDASY